MRRIIPSHRNNQKDPKSPFSSRTKQAQCPPIMERPPPSSKKQQLSPEGTQRLQQAASVHSAIWSDVFKGRDVFRMMAPNRQRVIECRMPRIEQILDFVRRYFACTVNGEKRVAAEIAIPIREPAHAQCNVVFRVLLSHEFGIDG